jgi:FkbM family methyltransferase
MGDFKIDAFEPNLKNIMRFCESLEMNGWKNEQERTITAGQGPTVNIWPSGISDKSGTLKFYEDWGNPGAGRFGQGGNMLRDRQDFSELPVMTLDKFATERGWFQSRPNIAILKVDVERHEANVLVGANELLNARIVQNIFTEVSFDKGSSTSIEMQKDALKLLVQAGYKLAGQGGWQGPKEASRWPNDEMLVHNIFAFIETSKQHYLNLWWKL